ncbi:MAG: c-type cytochrome [Caldimonas sp.]
MKKISLATLAAVLVAGSMTMGTAARAQDAKAGEKKVAMCIGCHNIPGYQASFPEIYKVPKIAGQNAKYLIAALNAYKKGERKHPSMRAIATTLSDQDMADVAAYYEQLEKGGAVPAGRAEAPADIAKLLAKANCESCHGKNFSAPIDPSYPKIAGQYADYLYIALKAYQTDGNPHIGRSNAIMMGMARPYTHAEIKSMAKYISSLPGELKSVQLPEFR